MSLFAFGKQALALAKHRQEQIPLVHKAAHLSAMKAARGREPTRGAGEKFRASEMNGAVEWVHRQWWIN